MKLYFSPLACSFATRAVLEEIGINATYVEVNRATKRLVDGADYRAIYPLALVPALETDQGELLTENVAILRHLGEQGSDLARGPRVDQWLSFVATELHKAIFGVVFDPNAPEAAKQYALTKGATRLAHVNAHMQDREYLADALSVADFYLFTVLTWTTVTPIALADYPALEAFHGRMGRRPSTRRAYDIELPLYRAFEAQRGAATSR